MANRKLVRFRAIARNVRLSTTIALWVCLVVSIGLLIASFLVPPMGEISPTVLKAGSLIFAFATLMEAREAIIEGLGIKLTHGDTTVIVRDVDRNNSQSAHQDESQEDAEIDDGYGKM